MCLLQLRTRSRIRIIHIPDHPITITMLFQIASTWEQRLERTGTLYQYHHGLQDEGRAADLPAGVQRGAAGRPPRHHRTLLQEEGEHGCLTVGFAIYTFSTQVNISTWLYTTCLFLPHTQTLLHYTATIVTPPWRGEEDVLQGSS